MANQEQSMDGVPRKDGERPSPDVERNASDGQSNTRGKGASDEQGQRPAGDRAYVGDGPGKVGLTSGRQPDLVAPSGVNERDHGAAEDKPMAGGTVNLDDDDMVHPRGKVTDKSGTWQAEGGDSAPLGKPGPGLSDRNGPSDPDNKKSSLGRGGYARD